jgi:hypothetical protein
VRTVGRDREVERRPGEELLAVDVPAPPTGRKRRVDACLRWGHSHHAEERRERHLEAERATEAPAELPVDAMVLGSPSHAPWADLDLVDADDERLSRLRAAYRDRARDRMSGVELGISRLELLARAEGPTGVRHRDPHGVTRLDLDDGLQLDREVAVQEALLERQLVDGH